MYYIRQNGFTFLYYWVFHSPMFKSPFPNSLGIILGSTKRKWGSFRSRNHFRVDLGIISGLGIISEAVQALKEFCKSSSALRGADFGWYSFKDCFKAIPVSFIFTERPQNSTEAQMAHRRVQLSRAWWKMRGSEGSFTWSAENTGSYFFRQNIDVPQ